MVIIHRKVSFCTIISRVKFFPGMNTISDAEMRLIENTSAFKSEIICGNMLIGGVHQSETSEAVEATSLKARAAKIASEIGSMQAKDATTMINSLNDTFILKALKSSDGRKGIQDAVDARLIAINSQEGSDLTPESKVAPEGNGEDFINNISGKKEDIDGGKVHTAIPALKEKK